ncbi:actin-like protein 7A [Antechinus flavipes]|uniref:actin-like protein 7A n=1 Tax=Antechinus flavipes TaxID=38775 RepID=UPI0022363B5D|nr:actin-like protein 7A [Antechinus flavipes]
MATCSIDSQEFCSRRPPKFQAPHPLGSRQPNKESMIVDIHTHQAEFGVVCEGPKFHGEAHCREALRSLTLGTRPILVTDNVVCPRSPTTLTIDPQQLQLSGKVQPWAPSPGPSPTSKVTDRQITITGKSVTRNSHANLEERGKSVTPVPTKIGLLSSHIPLEPSYFVGQNILTYQKETFRPRVTSGKGNPTSSFWAPQTYSSSDTSRRAVTMEHRKGAMLRSQCEEPACYGSTRGEGRAVHSYQGSLIGGVCNAAEVPRKNNAESLQYASLFHKELATASVTSSMGSAQPSMQSKGTSVLRMSLSPDIHVCAGKDGTSQGMASQNSNAKASQDTASSTSYRKSSDKTSSIGPSCPSVIYKTLPMAVVDKGSSYTKYSLTEPSENRTVINPFGLLRGPSYELVSNADFQERPPSQVASCHPTDLYKSLAAVVIDTGTGFSKCGLAGEDRTRAVVPTRVGIHRSPQGDSTPYYITEDAEAACSTLIRGVVSDWDALEVLWNHIFYSKLCVDPEELAVLVADSPVSPCTNREKVVELLFECFGVPAMQTVHQALLTLYAYGRTTGLVMGSGHGTSYVAPIITGELERLNISRLDVAGKDLSEYLSQLLLAGGQPPPKADVLTHMKETCCYVTLDMVSELCQVEGKYRLDFVLPDKHVLSLGAERFRCPEILFKPDILGLDQPSLPQLAQISISQLEPHLQERLLANVVLEGGTTLLNGFSERVQRDLGPAATVLSLPHRAIAAWLGGSIMASLDSFQTLWLSRGEYQEEGPWAIYKYHL